MSLKPIWMWGWWEFESSCFYAVGNCVRYVELFGSLMRSYGCCCCCWDCGLLVNVQGFVNAGEKAWLIQLILLEANQVKSP